MSLTQTCKVTVDTKETHELVVQRADLIGLLSEKYDVPKDAEVTIRGIPHQCDWELEDRGPDDGVHLLVNWTKRTKTDYDLGKCSACGCTEGVALVNLKALCQGCARG